MTQLQFTNALLDLQSKLRYYALSLTADREKADDLVQETLLKALSNRDKFASNTNFKAWVYTIMKNTFINDYRRNVKAKTTLEESNSSKLQISFSKDDYYPSVDSIYSEKEIYKKIEMLDDEFREPFQLFLKGYKYKEIADELNLPLGTVKSRIFFTRKKLGRWLNEYVN